MSVNRFRRWASLTGALELANRRRRRITAALFVFVFVSLDPMHVVPMMKAPAQP